MPRFRHRDPVEMQRGLIGRGGHGLVLVDHKSDAVLTADSLAHYRSQLDGYAELLRRATGRPIVRRLLLHLPGDSAAVVDVTAVVTP